jgi:glycosyltransferase involved in cell wall biosynthesis
MNKKHVAIFVSSFNLGGVERAFITLANSFVDDGHAVDFIVSLNEGILKSELNAKVNIVSFDETRLRKSFSKLYYYIKATSADLLITGPTYPNIIAILCNLLAFGKIKIVVTQHNYQDLEMENLGLIGKIAPYLIKLTYKYAYKVVAVSEGVKTDLIDNYNINPQKILVIYNAVLSDSFFRKSQEMVDYNFEKNYLVAVGRLEIVKNYPFLLKVYSKMKSEIADFNLDLVILGDGSEKENLEKQILELKLQENVHLLGALSNPLPIIKNAKALIHSSFSESMGLVYVEALALNVPVVTTINKGAIEVLKEVDQKVIIDSHNVNDFITGILKILKNEYPKENATLDKFRSDRIRDSYLNIIYDK